MLKKLFSKSTKPRKCSFTSTPTSSLCQPQQSNIGTQFRSKCLNITKQYPTLQQSTFYTTHLCVLMQTPQISSLFMQKIMEIKKQFNQNTVYEKYLASIILNIMEQDGLFYIFVKLWINFCVFQFKKIIEGNKDKQNNQEKEEKEKQKQEKIDKNSQQEKQMKVRQVFHKQFFLLCYFIYQIVLYLYEKQFASLKQGFSEKQIYKLIRNTITCSVKWSEIHYTFRKHIKCHRKTTFTDHQVDQNMKQLQKICKISLIPIPFMDSINIMKQFVSCAQIQKKLKKCVELVQSVKREMMEYRIINGMEESKLVLMKNDGNQIKERDRSKVIANQNKIIEQTQSPSIFSSKLNDSSLQYQSQSQLKKSTHIFCADDILSALTYVMWRLNKNIFGPCTYIQIILCSEYESIEYQHLANELDMFGDNVRHAFDTLRSVARIQMVSEEIMISIT